MILEWTAPLPLIWRYRVNGPHVAGTIWSRARGQQPFIQNTMRDVFGNDEYVEHVIWETLDLAPWLAPGDAVKPLIVVRLDIKCEITSRAIGQHGMGVKILNPRASHEDAPTDFQQPAGSHWVQNTAQAAQYGPGTVRSWTSVLCAPYERMVAIGACWRPAFHDSDVEMAAEIHLEAYATG